jgi:diguanylate cyclase (GGDEF)-like protein
MTMIYHMGEFTNEFKESSRKLSYELHERIYDAVIWCRDTYLNIEAVRATIDSFAVLVFLFLVDRSVGHPEGLRMAYILPIWLAAKRGGRIAGYANVAATTALLTEMEVGTQTSAQATAVNAVLRFVVLAGLMAFIENFESNLRKYATMAKKDSLTNCLNRLGLDEFAMRAIDRALGAGNPLTIAMIDCDKFKELNDQNGHSYGDHILKTLAKLLRKYGTGCTLARNGGDEFVLVMPGKTPYDARVILERVNWKFRESTVLADRCASFSYGISRLGVDGTNLRDLMVAADKDMYIHKAAKGNAAVIEVPMIRRPA